MLHVGLPELTRRGDRVTYEVSVSGGAGPQTLWFEVGCNGSGELVSDRADAALVALLIPAMQQGRDLVLDGPVTEELLHQVRHGCQEVLRRVCPVLTAVDVEARATMPAQPAARGVFSGFSAGVDSFMTLADHYLSEQVPDAYRLDHLVFNNVGSHHGQQPLFRKRLTRVAALSETLGLPLIEVDSNVDDFYSGLDFGRGAHVAYAQTHSMRNASVAFLLQAGAARFLHSSTFAYQSIRVAQKDDISIADAVLLPLLSTPAVELRSVGSEYTRIQKTMRVAEIPEAWTSLDVCTRLQQDAINCSTCWKCLLTELTLEIGGVLERFSPVFDLDRYEQARDGYIPTVLAGVNINETVFMAWAEERNFRFSRAARVRAATIRTASHLPAPVRSAQRRARSGVSRTARVLRASAVRGPDRDARPQ